MKQGLVNKKNVLLVLLMVLGWFAIGAQFYLMINNRIVSIPQSIVRFFSYFTILTNLTIVICATTLLFFSKTFLGKFFNTTSTQTALTVYIIIVGIVYNLILRFLWQPQGLQYPVDEILHTVIPILFLFFWFFCVQKERLKYSQAFFWLIYPFTYLIYTLIHGAISDFYPYPFVDVSQLGYWRVVVNSCGLVLAFLGLSFFLIAFGNFFSRK